MDIIFSIITINYNNSVGLKKTIESVISQNFRNFEYLIIDGESSDLSVEIIEEYKSNINYSISEKDNGVYHAMNKGIDMCRGEYIIFMNSGDTFYDSNSLRIYSNHIIDGFGVYYGNSEGIFNDGNVFDIIQPSNLDLNFWLFSTINHQATAIKRELFELYGYYDETLKVTADWRFFFKLNIVYNIQFKKINEYLAKYDMHGISSIEGIITHEHESFIMNNLSKYWSVYKILKQQREPVKNIKRLKQFEYLQNFKIPFRFLKSFMDILLFFVPKR